MIIMCFLDVLNKALMNGYYSREGAMCILVYWNIIGCPDLAKLRD